MTTREMVAGVAKRNSEALSELYRNLQKEVTFLFRQECPEHADDLLNELWLKISRNIEDGKLEDPDAVYSYSRRIARAMISDQQRRDARLAPLDEERLA